MPAPRRECIERLESLEASNVSAESEVPVADLEGCGVGGGCAVGVEVGDDSVAVDFGGGLRG